MPSHSPQITQWLQLIHADGVGPVTFSKLMSGFSSIEAIFDASVKELTKIDGIGNKTAESIARTLGKYDADTEIGLADSHGVMMLTMDDSRYPAALREIHDPPPVLYVKGTLERSDALSAAIVGSRRCSLYGQEQAGRFAHLLAASGFTVISGMARGIDSAAHRGAMTAGGRTIAVQGCGLGKIFPPENKELFAQICEHGACISEFPINTEPLAEHFPSRNRIIAGLTLGTLVIEATANSGALITAKAALEYNREVMAVPGKIDSPLSSGAHKLIKEGAKLIESIEDVLEALGYVGERIRPHVTKQSSTAQDAMEAPLFDIARINLSGDEQKIFDCLSKEPIHLEEIISTTQLPAGAINAALIALRLKGLIKQLPGSSFLRR